MIKQRELPYPIANTQILIEQKLQQAPNLILMQLNQRTFKIVSKQNFGFISMIEKEHFTIRGKFIPTAAHTQIIYEVKANATFSTFSIVLPIMFLPTLVLGAAGNKEYLLTNLIIYVLMCGLSVAFLLHLGKQYQRKGEQIFESFLNTFDNKN